MRVLFLTHTRLGDAVLSTGVVNHYATQYPHAKLTVVCSPLVAGLFSAMPNVEKVIAVRKRSYARHWWDIWRGVVGTHWDVVIDLRNSAVSRLVLARKRHIWKDMPDTLHKVRQVAAIIGVDPPPAPRLWFDTATQDKAARFLAAANGLPCIVIAPVANWPGKMWPAEKFIELIDRLDKADDRPFPQPVFVIMAGPGEEAVAEQVLAACPVGRSLSAIACFSPQEAACVIASCDAFIGNDSGLMHCAAASGVPTLGLFGPSNREVYGPWGDNTRMVTTPESFAELLAHPSYTRSVKVPSLMTSLRVDDVYAALKDILHARKRA